MEAQKQIYSVIKWNAVASWMSNEVSPNCSICKNSLDSNSTCNDCIILGDPNIKCPPTKGQCGHIYHKHCLDRWFSVQKNQLCPLDQHIWNPF